VVSLFGVGRYGDSAVLREVGYELYAKGGVTNTNGRMPPSISMPHDSAVLKEIGYEFYAKGGITNITGSLCIYLLQVDNVLPACWRVQVSTS
jgi:hypothetical protein